MSAYYLLIAELARSGGRTTYAQLLRRHGRHYDREHFFAAGYKARRLGIVTPDGGKGRPIVATGACPCCGRTL